MARGRLLGEEKVQRVEKLLADGVSQRAIARETGVSRTRVAAILDGSWRRQQAKRLAAREKRRQAERLGTFEECAGTCPGCGSLCYRPMAGWPCLACRIRRLCGDSGRAPTGFAASAGVVQLHLHPEDHARYLEVRAAREAAGDRPASWEDEWLDPTDAELERIERGTGGEGA